MLEETPLRPARANFQIWVFSGSSSSLKYYRAPNGARIRNVGFVLLFIWYCAHDVLVFLGFVPAARRAACMMHCDLRYKVGAGQPEQTQSVFSLTRGVRARPRPRAGARAPSPIPKKTANFLSRPVWFRPRQKVLPFLRARFSPICSHQISSSSCLRSSSFPSASKFSALSH